jgi:hypothetical protein
MQSVEQGGPDNPLFSSCNTPCFHFWTQELLLGSLREQPAS